MTRIIEIITHIAGKMKKSLSLWRVHSPRIAAIKREGSFCAYIPLPAVE